MLSSRLQRRRRYLAGILVLALLFSVGVNLYDHFVLIPQLQATINNMRVQAFNAWMGEMTTVKNILKRAETNLDVEDARDYISLADDFANMAASGIDIPEYQYHTDLYHWILTATFFLEQAIAEIHHGNATGGFSPPVDLDSIVLVMIENVTRNIENLGTEIRGSLSQSGIEPTQQLREAEVLTDVLSYLEQLYQISSDIIDYYR